MHVASWICGHLFFLISKYIFSNSSQSDSDRLNILDVGSADVNGNIKDALYTSNFNNLNYNYVGLDMDSNNLNVDVVVEPGQYPLNWPFEKESFDIIISSSCLEHDDYPWETFAHMVEKLKPGGLIYLSLPSKVDIHRYPVDNWRFLPDSAYALAKWANRYNKASNSNNGRDTGTNTGTNTDNMNIHVLFSELIPNNDYETDIVMIFYKSDAVPLATNIFQLFYYKYYLYNRIIYANIHQISFGNEFFNKIPINIRNNILLLPLPIEVEVGVTSPTPKDDTMEHYLYNLKNLEIQQGQGFMMSYDMLLNLEDKYMTWNVHCREPYKQLEFIYPDPNAYNSISNSNSIPVLPIPYTSYTISLAKQKCTIKYTILFIEKDFYNDTYIEDTWNVILQKAHVNPDLIPIFVQETISMKSILKQEYDEIYTSNE